MSTADGSEKTTINPDAEFLTSIEGLNAKQLRGRISMYEGNINYHRNEQSKIRIHIGNRHYPKKNKRETNGVFEK